MVWWKRSWCEHAQAAEARVLEHVNQCGKGSLYPRIDSQIDSGSLALEKRMNVAYLGPEGTFSEMAVQKGFGSSVEGLPGASIDEVFRQGESGLASYAVVPIENSTEGAVGRTMDLLVTTSLQICGEVVLRVRQNLMASKEVPLSSFTHVYSHPQSLGQCAGWLLHKLPAAKQIPVASNADAARRVVGEPSSCAIGPELAAQRYGLHVLAAGIEDDSRNMTRFLILGTVKTSPSGHDRTSLVMSAPNKPGAVVELISPFAQNSVSMTRIESRPARTGQWEYLFFIDVEGHQEDEPVRHALDQVRAKAPFLKILGSYPAAQL